MTFSTALVLSLGMGTYMYIYNVYSTVLELGRTSNHCSCKEYDVCSLSCGHPKESPPSRVTCLRNSPLGGINIHNGRGKYNVYLQISMQLTNGLMAFGEGCFEREK